MTMMILHASLLGSLLLAGTSPSGSTHSLPSEMSEAQLVGRTFDLSAFRLSCPKGSYQRKSHRALPMMRPISDARQFIESGGEGWELEESEAERIVSTFLTDGDAGVETCELTDDGMLYVEAPVETLAEFDELQSKLLAHVLGGPKLEIRRLMAGGDLPDGLLQGGIVPRTTVDAWLQGTGASGVRSVTLPSGGAHIVTELESHTINSGVDTEIAQGVAALRASVREVAVGSELTLSGYRVGEGVQLAYSASETRRRDRKGRDGVMSSWTSNSESGRVHTEDSTRWDEAFAVSGGTVAGEAYLKKDECLVLVTGTAHGQIYLTAIGLDPQSMAGSALASGDASSLQSSAWWIAPRGLIEPLTIGASWHGARRPRSFETETRETLDGGEGILSVEFSSNGRSLLGRLLESQDIHDEMEFGGSLLVQHSAGASAAIERFAAADAARERGQLQVSVTARDHRGMDALRGSLTIRNGGAGAVVSGFESLLAKEMDLEVAQWSSARVPRSITHFEGLALTLELAEAPGAKLAYRVQGQLSTDLFSEDSAANQEIDKGLTGIHAAHLVIDERGVVTAGADGTWTIVFGDGGTEGARVQLAVRGR